MCNLEQNTLSRGVGKIIEYDNIAIVVLFMCLAASFVFNYMQWKQRNVNDGVLPLALEAIKEALTDLKITITVLNERIGHK